MGIAFDIFKNERNVKEFAPGEVVFNEGDAGDYMCAVLEGEVAIVKNGKTYEVVQADGIFGELALIDRSPRNASAVAQTRCKVALVDARRFQYLIQGTPFFALQVMTVMANRLRAVMKD